MTPLCGACHWSGKLLRRLSGQNSESIVRSLAVSGWNIHWVWNTDNRRKELCLHYSAGGRICSWASAARRAVCMCVYVRAWLNIYFALLSAHSVHKCNIICYPPKPIILSGPMMLSQWNPGGSPGPCVLFSMTSFSPKRQPGPPGSFVC